MGVLDTIKKNLFWLKQKIKKSQKLTPADFKTGKLIMFGYNAKDKSNPYDKTPLIFVLRRNKSHTLGLNLHWVPPKYRKAFLDYILKKNKKNIRRGLPLRIRYNDIKPIIARTGLRAVTRLYINSRISMKGAVMEPDEWGYASEIRSENFTGISAEKAWKMAQGGKM